ncbi:MAG: gliding motility-associated C-terminal domain-containing protein, partial [Saprospiraceae bacterium]
YLDSMEEATYSSLSLFSNLMTGEYSVAIQDANGCTGSADVSVSSPPAITLDLGEDLTIDLGEAISITAVTNQTLQTLDTIIWQSQDDSLSCDFCLRQEVRPFDTNRYNILLVDENGCEREDDILVSVQKDRGVYIPNAFSPNGDGNNDWFTVFAGPQVVKIRSLKIFNRWGEQVFEAVDFFPNDELLGWNGNFKGEAVNPDVLVYWTEVEFIDGFVKLIKGDVTVMK